MQRGSWQRPGYRASAHPTRGTRGYKRLKAYTFKSFKGATFLIFATKVTVTKIQISRLARSNTHLKVPSLFQASGLLQESVCSKAERFTSCSCLHPHVMGWRDTRATDLGWERDLWRRFSRSSVTVLTTIGELVLARLRVTLRNLLKLENKALNQLVQI